jgi:fructose-bisphosphate aldolase class I
MTSLTESEFRYAFDLVETARLIASSSKCILAADESIKNFSEGFESINLENSEENRRKYRAVLFSMNDIQEFVSGVLLSEESLYPTDSIGANDVVEILKSKCIIPGITVDQGIKAIHCMSGERLNVDFSVRCKKYFEHGVRFAKCREVLPMENGNLSISLVDEYVRAFASYASICQSCGLVPVLAPEIQMDGDFPVEMAAVASEKMLAALVKALSDHHVMLEGTLIITNMVRSGSKAVMNSSAREIALATVRVLQHTVPCAVAGIHLSPGDIPEEKFYDVVNCMKECSGPIPWALGSFVVGHNIHPSVLSNWRGLDVNKEAAQKVFRIKTKNWIRCSKACE